MRMRAMFVTTLSAFLLVYADLRGWSSLAIVGTVCIASAAVSLSDGKWSPYATGLVVALLITCDALSRYNESEPSMLHNSVTLGDLSYAICVFAILGWIGGRMLRTRHVTESRTKILQPPLRPYVISPVFIRRRLPRVSNQ